MSRHSTQSTIGMKYKFDEVIFTCRSFPCSRFYISYSAAPWQSYTPNILLPWKEAERKQKNTREKNIFYIILSNDDFCANIFRKYYAWDEKNSRSRFVWSASVVYELKAKSVCVQSARRRRWMQSHARRFSECHILLCVRVARVHLPFVLVGDKRASHAPFFLRSEFYSFGFIYFSALCMFSSAQCSIVFFFAFRILFYGYWILMHISHIYFIYFMTKCFEYLVSVAASSHPLFRYV